MHGPIGYIHLVSAFMALFSGGVVVAVRKATPLHRLLGLTYVFAMLSVNASALALYHMTGYFGPFHVLAVVSLTSVLIGLSAPILRRGDWLRRHFYWMGWSYLGLFAAALAEALVRVPALQIHSAARGFAVGLGAALLVGIAGRILMPRLARDAIASSAAQ